jgi:hypothetical protein
MEVVKDFDDAHPQLQQPPMKKARSHVRVTKRQLVRYEDNVQEPIEVMKRGRGRPRKNPVELPPTVDNLPSDPEFPPARTRPTRVRKRPDQLIHSYEKEAKEKRGR